ncbi:proline-rich receptor-like protein kinase PERK1 isoform X4 [Eucalyptus grandis]|uniref:proline-rich receptor-like protein kinase PERK1 isoform X4 n=1 Tax=Eucalyptus grandis TaxID=71139 RepID=UPI00192EDB81|nr:proline-rich receptor-like protein kinase PERK1 isoform X4 [Eucalyptus grandis]
MPSASSGSPSANSPSSWSTILTKHMAAVAAAVLALALMLVVVLKYCLNRKNRRMQLRSASPNILLGSAMCHFTLEQVQAFTSHFSGASLLGRGGYGCVYRGVLPNGEEVAVKRLDVGSGQGERGGQSTLPWEARMRVAVGSAKGLAYLHEDCHPTIVHRDIKAANILVNFDFEANIADFGLAKSASESNQGESRPVGTFGYVAPEYALGGELTPNLDTFSFGVVLLELITGRRPVGSTHNSLNDNLVYSTRPYLTQALEDGNFDSLVDPRLQNNYNPSEMARMVACAAACVRESAGCRPKMSLIARVLEGHQSAADLDDGTGAGPSNLDLEDGNSNYREPTGGYGLPCPSGSSSEGPSCQTARDLEMGRM